MLVCPNIIIKELVCNHVYKVYGDEAIKFIDPKLIETINIIRNKIIQAPIIINNGSTYTQRGLRCNCCSSVVEKTSNNITYLSAHIFGKAIDFHCPSITIREIHKIIKKNQDLLPYNIRIESIKSAPTWVHIDVFSDKKEKVYTFN